MTTKNPVSAAQEYIQEIIFGANDGIVTIFSVVASLAASGSSSTVQIGGASIVVIGLANVLAGGTSMGLGSYMSVVSEKDMYKTTRKMEKKLISKDKENEIRETLNILQKRGYTPEESKKIVAVYSRNPTFWTDFMMQYEYEMPKPDAHPLRNALATFVSFVVFGSIPLLPYIFIPTQYAFLSSICGSLCAFVVLAVFRTAITKVKFIRSLIETVGIGICAGSIAYFVGVLFQ